RLRGGVETVHQRSARWVRLGGVVRRPGLVERKRGNDRRVLSRVRPVGSGPRGLDPPQVSYPDRFASGPVLQHPVRLWADVSRSLALVDQRSEGQGAKNLLAAGADVEIGR